MSKIDATVIKETKYIAVWVLILMPMRPSIAMVELSYPVTWSITSLMFIIYYLFGGWMGRCIKRAGHSAEEQQ